MDHVLFAKQEQEAAETSRPVILSLNHDTHPITWVFFPSGFQLLIFETQSPLCTVQLNIRAGSRNDSIMGTGHFVEHLLQKDVLGQGEHPRLANIARHGIKGNATTSHCHTRYFRTCFAEHAYELVTGLLSLGFDFSSFLGLEQILRERPIIYQEIRRSWREAARQQQMHQALYPTVPWTHNRPFGTIESVASLTAAHLRTFFDARYRLANASLTIHAPQLELDRLLQIVTELHHRIPSGPLHQRTVHDGDYPTPVGGIHTLQTDVAQSEQRLYLPLSSDFQKWNLLRRYLRVFVDYFFHADGSFMTQARRREGLLYSLRTYQDHRRVSAHATIRADKFDRFAALVNHYWQALLSGEIDQTRWNTFINRRRLEQAEALVNGQLPDLSMRWLYQDTSDIDANRFVEQMCAIGTFVAETLRPYLKDLAWGQIRFLPQKA